MALTGNDILLPRANAALVNKDGTATIEFRNFLLRFVQDAGAAGAVTEEQLAALTARVQALEDAALEDMLQGFYSVSVNGNIIYLVGDVANPQGSQYYGTDRDGVRGWYNIIDGFEAGTGLIKTVSTDGFNFLGYITSTSQLPPTGALNDAYILNGQYIYWNGTEWANGGSPSNIATLALAPLADSGAGALLAITRDTYGRVSGTKSATITGTSGQINVANGNAVAGLPTLSLADVADSGAGVLLATTFDSKGRKTGSRAATITGTTNQIDVANGTAAAGLPTLSLSATVLTSLGKANTAVQSVVAGSGITVDSTNPQNPIVIAKSGTFIGGVELTTSFVSSSAGSAIVPIPGMTFSFTMPDRPVMISFGSTAFYNSPTTSNLAAIILRVNGVDSAQLFFSAAITNFWSQGKQYLLSGVAPGTTINLAWYLNRGPDTFTVFAAATDKPYIYVVTA